jgi:hypothetical protein
MQASLLSFLAIPLASVVAHSWVGCTNYAAVSTDYQSLGAFDRNKCSGYPRGFQTQFSKEQTDGWGADTGYDWERAQCRIEFDNNDYSDATPMAIYRSGDTIHLSHPSKNHVADACTSPFIPSHSLKLKMSRQPRADTFDVEISMIGPDHQNGQIDHAGFQNCYQFCNNMDRAHCLTSWKLPIIEEAGRYSFSWVWEFNPGQFYSTCFDAMILVNQSIPAPTPFVSTPSILISPTESPIATPAPTESLTDTPADTPTPAETPSTILTTSKVPATALPIITSDATQLKSIFSEVLQSIQFVIAGAMNITIRLP